MRLQSLRRALGRRLLRRELHAEIVRAQQGRELARQADLSWHGSRYWQGRLDEAERVLSGRWVAR